MELFLLQNVLHGGDPDSYLDRHHTQRFKLSVCFK
jgi:hypothetical protein